MFVRAGVDIGGTKTQAVAIDKRGALVDQIRLPTGFGQDAVLSSAVDSLTRLAAAVRVPVGEFESIGVGLPGIVDHDSGYVQHAVNLGLHELDFGTELGSRLGRTVRVENDVNAAAFGVFHRMAEHRTVGSSRSMAYLNLGTGVAAGLVLDGKLWRGSRGGAGEIGHIPLDPDGPICNCGQRGCLETMASGSAIARLWPTSHRRPVEELFAAAAAGDAHAREVRRTLVENVASAVRVLVLAVDVELVVLGGGISSLGAPLLGAVRAVLDSRAAQSPFLASLDLSARVEVAPAGFPAAAVGAALLQSSSAA
jgi:glucokinase